MPSSHSLPSTVWAVPSSGAKIFSRAGRETENPLSSGRVRRHDKSTSHLATARWSTDKSGNGQPGEISVGNEFAR